MLVSGYAGRAAVWSVDLGTGDATRSPYLLGATGVDGDRAAEVVFDRGQRFVDVWDGSEQVSSLSITGFDSLLFPALRGTSVAAAREVASYAVPRVGAAWDGLFAFDAVDGVTRGYLPVRDQNAWYARYGLVPFGWVDDDEVLARVIPKSSGGGESAVAYLITWDVETGELARVSSYDVTSSVALAADLLGPVD